MRARESLFIFLLLAAPFFFLSGELLSSRVYFARDLTYLFHPWRALQAQMVQSGEMPLWNSYQMGGMPFLANGQSSVLYPFTLLFNFLNFALALKFFHWFQYALAGIGLYLLARKLRFHPWISFTGGIIFAYNGYALTRSEFLSLIGSLIWLPMIILFAGSSSYPVKTRHWREKIFTRDIVFCSIAFCLSLFAGYPQIFLLEGCVALLFSITARGFRNAVYFWPMVGGIVLSIGAAQWLPTLELTQLSIRSGNGLPLHEAGTYSFPLYDLAGLINPFALTRHPDQFSVEKFFWIYSAWWGMASTAALLFAFHQRRKRLALLSFTVFAAGLIWAMGTELPLYEFLFSYLPLVRLFRYPSVVLYWTVSGATLLTLCGMEGLKIHLKKHGATFIALVGCLAITELFYYSRHFMSALPSDFYTYQSDSVRQISNNNQGLTMLAPRISLISRIEGNGVYDIYLKLRRLLSGLTNLPYRIATLTPAGEPLALKSYHQLYTSLLTAKSIDQARPILNLWNVRNFLTDQVLDKSWDLKSKELYANLYTNPQAFGLAYALGKNNKRFLPVRYKRTNYKIMAEYLLDENALGVFVQPKFPGWLTYCVQCSQHATGPIESISFLGYFHALKLAQGRHRLYLIYQPASWRIALMLCAAGLGLLILSGALAYKRAFRPEVRPLE